MIESTTLKEETKDFKCHICHKPFKVNQQAYIMELGEFRKDDFGGIGFDKLDTVVTNLYMCIDCAFKIEETK